MTIAFHNGDFLPLESVCISPLDRGFLFGDSVYEVIPSYGGEPFLLDEHLDRLARSLAGIRLPDPYPRAEWEGLLHRLLRENGGDRAGDLGIYLQVTRGVAPRDHAFPQATPPTVFAMVSPIRALADSTRREGVAAVTGEDHRWGRCDIKATTLLANVLARQTATEQGAAEAILLSGGQVSEGAASNVFAVIGDTVVTPPLAPNLLPGITRALVIRLIRDAGFALAERPLSEAELRSASEIWLTSSTREVLPVTRLDGVPVGDAVPGPVWQAVHAAYQAAKPGTAGAAAAVREGDTP